MTTRLRDLPLHPEYIEFALEDITNLQDQEFLGCPFRHLSMIQLDVLGVPANDYRARANQLVQAGYDWQPARDVATYEALLSVGDIYA